MLAVDTNVVVRLVADDDAKQAAAARRVFAAGPVWLSKTVLLETAWVLKSVYGLTQTQIRDAMTNLLGFDHVQAEDEASVSSALELTAQGLDFADAMHLVGLPTGVRFLTFDRKLVRRATRAKMSGVVELLSDPDR